MSRRKDKQITRFKSIPADFTWNELVTVMGWCEFDRIGGTNSRHQKFYNRDADLYVSVVKPHPGNEVQRYVLRAVYRKLKNNKLI